VLIAAAFCMFNRYVDGLASWSPDDPGLYDRIGKLIAEHGYLNPPRIMLPALLALPLEHFAYPPPGVTLVDIASRPSVAPLQLVGTLDPPTLVLNGKPVKLRPAGFAHVSGEAGSFFVELSGAAAVMSALEVNLSSASEGALEAKAVLNRRVPAARERVFRGLSGFRPGTPETLEREEETRDL
jgi:hypothetical protein